MDKDRLLEALNEFFEEDFDKASDAGYTLTTEIRNNKPIVNLEPSTDDIPEFEITTSEPKSGEFVFKVVVTFPELDLDKYYSNETLRDIVDSWSEAIDLADEIESLKFIPEDYGV